MYGEIMIKKVICITILFFSTFTFSNDDYAKKNNLAIVPHTEQQAPSSNNNYIIYEEKEEEEPEKYSQPPKELDPQIQNIENALQATQEKVTNGKKFLEQLHPVLEKTIGPRKLSEVEHQLAECMNTAYSIRIQALEIERDRRLLSLIFMDPEIAHNLVQQAIERGVTLKDNKNQLQANPLDVLEQWAHMIQKIIQQKTQK